MSVHQLCCLLPWTPAMVLVYAVLPMVEAVAVSVWGASAMVRGEAVVHGLIVVPSLWHSLQGLVLLDRLSTAGLPLRGTVMATVLGLLPGCYGYFVLASLIRGHAPLG